MSFSESSLPPPLEEDSELPAASSHSALDRSSRPPIDPRHSHELGSARRREVGRAAVALSRALAQAFSSYASVRGPDAPSRTRIALEALDRVAVALEDLSGAIRALRDHLSERLEQTRPAEDPSAGPPSR